MSNIKRTWHPRQDRQESPSSVPQENAPLKVARDPGDPTTKERGDHNATHIPFRSWCPICVKAKGREEAHRYGRGKERICKASISFDYKTFGQEDGRGDKATAIVYKDDHTKMIFDMFASERERQTRG